MFDIIGDVHGHAEKLEDLLAEMGYSEREGSYRHPEGRRAVFLGDLIDRGPNIRRVLQIARSMAETENAMVIMGNHELNALCFHTEIRDQPGLHLRPHTSKNVTQHKETLEQLYHPGEMKYWLDWFRTLPPWLELEGFRTVHACWDPRSIEALNGALSRHKSISEEFLHEAMSTGERNQPNLHQHLEISLKGKEAELPEGVFFIDKEGTRRSEIRTRWYLPAEGQTYSTYALQTDPLECHVPIERKVAEMACPYPNDARPVFVGHYWLSGERPLALAHNVACLDYSVAKGGFLCAYRWDGEKTLDNSKFFWCR